MRKFEYFLYENFDADKETDNPYNPRRFFDGNTDAVLSEVSLYLPNGCFYGEICGRFGADRINALCDIGILRIDGGRLLFDCPIFLKEDAAALRRATEEKAVSLSLILKRGIYEIRSICAKIENGFSVEENLYHILCGMVFDGYFFDYLSEKGVLSVSRKHCTGLDYLTVIYEKCGELNELSDGLLCSYNRFANSDCSLQSFGDANGDRFDFYRFFRLREKSLYGGFLKAEELLRYIGGDHKNAILSETAAFIKAKRCNETVKRLLELFGYAENGKLCVPVFLPDHGEYISEIADIAQRLLGEEMSAALGELSGRIDITAARHGVNHSETANELYHILFGSINEQLVKMGIVASPDSKKGEGRYLKAIMMY